MNKQSDQKLVLDKRPENQTKTLKLPPPLFLDSRMTVCDRIVF